ncbi:TPA: nucleotidyltransferase domain-containing protein [Candidatus Poribacteria bacterium]|nr:nucleotidyltransferase domain-containing protein [Candidatus Poribacteria bacterium]
MVPNELSQNKIKEIVDRIVGIAHPNRIILFGSCARGEMRSNSDVDLLVIKGGKYNYYRLLGDIHKSLHGIGIDVDIVLVTPEQVQRYCNTRYLVIAPALKDGIEIYHDQMLYS